MSLIRINTKTKYILPSSCCLLTCRIIGTAILGSKISPFCRFCDPKLKFRYATFQYLEVWSQNIFVNIIYANDIFIRRTNFKIFPFILLPWHQHQAAVWKICLPTTFQAPNVARSLKAALKLDFAWSLSWSTEDYKTYKHLLHLVF